MRRLLIGGAILALSVPAHAGTDTQVNGVNATDTITMLVEVTNSITITIAGDGTNTVLTAGDSTLDFGQADGYGTKTDDGTSGDSTVNATLAGAYVIGQLGVQIDFVGYGDADITLERNAVSGTGAGTPTVVYNVGIAGDWSAIAGTDIPESPAAASTVEKT